MGQAMSDLFLLTIFFKIAIISLSHLCTTTVILIVMFKVSLQILFISVIVLRVSCYANDSTIAGLSQGQKWEKSHSDSGLTVYTSKVPNSNLVGFKMTGVVASNVRPLMATLRNVERSAEWTPELINKKTIENISDNEAITYSLNNLPWPLSNRDFILHNKLYLSQDKKLLYVISESVKHKDYPVKDDTVRAWIHYSNIGLRPINDKQTYVEWTLHVDPKGSLPAWLVNFYQSRYPINFFITATKRANQVPLSLPNGMALLLSQLNNLLAKIP